MGWVSMTIPIYLVLIMEPMSGKEMRVKEQAGLNQLSGCAYDAPHPTPLSPLLRLQKGQNRLVASDPNLRSQVTLLAATDLNLWSSFCVAPAQNCDRGKVGCEVFRDRGSNAVLFKAQGPSLRSSLISASGISRFFLVPFEGTPLLRRCSFSRIFLKRAHPSLPFSRPTRGRAGERLTRRLWGSSPFGVTRPSAREPPAPVEPSDGVFCFQPLCVVLKGVKRQNRCGAPF